MNMSLFEIGTVIFAAKGSVFRLFTAHGQGIQKRLRKHASQTSFDERFVMLNKISISFGCSACRDAGLSSPKSGPANLFGEL
jgi:hypothetical protein